VTTGGIAPVNIDEHVWYYRTPKGVEIVAETPRGSVIFRVQIRRGVLCVCQERKANNRGRKPRKRT